LQANAQTAVTMPSSLAGPHVLDKNIKKQDKNVGKIKKER